MTLERLDELIAAFPTLTIALVGDLFLDRYLELVPGVAELSIETGLEAYQVESVRNAPGALGTVMNNLGSLGVGRMLPVSVLGVDGHGFDLLESLQSLPVDDSYLLQVAGRLTPTYTKPLRSVDSQWVELNRLDVRTRAPLDKSDLGQLLERLRAAWSQADGLIVLDQIAEEECGVIGAAIREELLQLARREPEKLMLIDSRHQLGKFRAGVLKGNCGELLGAVGRPLKSQLEDQAVHEALVQLHQRDGQRLFCTDGPQGILIADDGGVQRVPGVKVTGPIDIVGAGDTVTAVLAASLLSGATPLEAAVAANLGASISIQQLGQTGVATREQILAALVAAN